MSGPKVSILVPVYGVERYIEKCARSLFEQTFGDIEYVFVNDRTKDRSIEVLRSVLELYPERKPQVRIVEHEKNLGLAGARNTAVALARGEYVLHVDSDDYLEPEAVERLVRVAEAERADIVVFDAFLEFEKRNTVLKSGFDSDKEIYLRKLISRQASAAVWGKLIRRSLYTDHNIDIPAGFDYGEDYAVSPRLAFFANRIAYLPEPLYHYVQYNAGAYTKAITEKRADGFVNIISFLETFFKSQGTYGRYKEDFDLSKLAAKVLILYLSDRKTQKKYAKVYRDIPRQKYKKNLGRQGNIVLSLGDAGLFPLISTYRRAYLLAYRIKRTIKPR